MKRNASTIERVGLFLAWPVIVAGIAVVMAFVLVVLMAMWPVVLFGKVKIG